MGEQRVSKLKDKRQMSRFVQRLLDDIRALEYMLENDWFESGVSRIGAEQEMCLVNVKNYKPATIADEALNSMKEYDWVETELAKFNLETNLEPRLFKGDCLSKLEAENREKLEKIRKKVHKLGAEVILTGILPTLRKSDLGLHNLTPRKRYRALMDAINEQLLGPAYELRLTGIDELLLKHDSPMLEAANTSFQVHLQVSPKDFVKMYNIAQVLAAPVMAVAANSPLVFGKRLWHESRIAMFQQALDTRSTHEHMRERSPRVHFGKDWLHHSILEIYREDIARFRVLLAADITENALEMIAEEKVPKLRALQVHNSTVYRWNRPCYGISENGKPHLRIENRVLPSGPTVLDEVANAAFWLGAMVGLADEVEDVREHLLFADVRDNFIKAARFGIDSRFNWFDEQKLSAVELIGDVLLPIAEKGLKKQKVKKADMDKYLGIIRARVNSHMTGARWQLRAYTDLKQKISSDEALATITAGVIKNQWKDVPVHEWEMPRPSDLPEYHPQDLLVEEFMETDLYTVQPDDLVEFVAELMDWRKIRYLPVEDSKGHLAGLITSRLLLRYFSKNGALKKKKKNCYVKDIMIEDPITILPEQSVVEAMDIMRDKKIGCLPVVTKAGELVGIITEMNFLRITGRLIDRMNKESQAQ